MLPEREVSESGFRSPREVAGARDLRARREPADAEKVGEPFVDPSLRDSQATAGKPEHGGRQRVALDLVVERLKHLVRRVQLALLEQRASRGRRR